MELAKILQFYIKHNCVIIPNKGYNFVFSNKEGTFADLMAVVYDSGYGIFKLYKNEKSIKFEDLSLSKLNELYENYMTIDKQKAIDVRIKNLKKDFI